jgi:hypothetical protein
MSIMFNDFKAMKNGLRKHKLKRETGEKEPNFLMPRCNFQFVI